MTDKFVNSLQEVINCPLVGREEKPRSRGLSMIIDKGMGLSKTEDILKLAAPYIDFIKLGFGTALFYDESLLKDKLALSKDYQVNVLPGGTFLEVSVLQGSAFQFLLKIKELGFDTVEISDGTIDLPANLRSDLIKEALNLDLRVLTEVGKKSSKVDFKEDEIIKQIKRDLSAGADKVIVEARESGQDVSIFDYNGEADEFKLKELLLQIDDVEDIIWEAPLKKQQAYFINLLGNNVNLGNIKADDIIALEALRNGLRSDTLTKVINCEKSGVILKNSEV